MGVQDQIKVADLIIQCKELRARRSTLENRHKLREATAAEFGALRLHNLRRSKKILNGQQKSIKDRNRVFLEKVTLAKDRVARIQYSTQAGQNFDDAKGAFMRKVEKLYPAWQEHVQAQKMAALRDLEKERNEAQQRRLLAKKTFEKEMAIHQMYEQARQDLELSNTLEKNEALTRQLERSKEVHQAEQWVVAIKNHEPQIQQHTILKYASESPNEQHIENVQAAIQKETTMLDATELSVDLTVPPKGKGSPSPAKREISKSNKTQQEKTPEKAASSLNKPFPTKRSSIVSLATTTAQKKFEKAGSFENKSTLPSEIDVAPVKRHSTFQIPKSNVPVNIPVKHTKIITDDTKQDAIVMQEVKHKDLAATSNDHESNKVAVPTTEVRNATALHLESKASSTALLSLHDRKVVVEKIHTKFENDATTCGKYNSSNVVPFDTRLTAASAAVTDPSSALQDLDVNVSVAILFDIITDISKDIFPSKAFDGKMTSAKLAKLHSSLNGGQGDIWEKFVSSFSHLIKHGCISRSTVISLCTTNLLHPDVKDSRSERKLHQFMETLFRQEESANVPEPIVPIRTTTVIEERPKSQPTPFSPKSNALNLAFSNINKSSTSPTKNSWSNLSPGGNSFSNKFLTSMDEFDEESSILSSSRNTSAVLASRVTGSSILNASDDDEFDMDF